MSKASLATLMVLCTALAACSETNTNRTLTAPDARHSAGEETNTGFGATVDGPFDVAFANDAAPMQMAASAQAASGGRASGHVAFSFTTPVLGISSEEYSFTALATDPSTPFAAKGQYEMRLTSASGVEQRFTGDVICMSIVGNTTRIAGKLTKVWVNNVQRPINAATHNIWTVVDNGEGQGTTDTASFLFFNNAVNAQNHCSFGFSPLQIALQQGNVQVQP